MAVKKKGAKRKRHVSKHVLKAREGKDKMEGEGQQSNNTIDAGGESSSKATDNVSNKKSKDNKHVKDPSEAAAYLTNWENRATVPGNWKFNKNTQSWLIRHCYEIEKVPKATFKLLLDYLQGLQGDKMRSHIKEEASRRARRYKDHVKNTSSTVGSSSAADDKGGDDSNDQKPENDNTQIHDNQRSDSNSTTTPATKKTEELDEDELRWRSLNDNDKRKEYKRARMILDIFKE